MADSVNAANLATSVDSLAQAVDKLRTQIETTTPAAPSIFPEALLAARRFKDILRGLQLRTVLAFTAQAASATEITLTWSPEPDLTPAALLRCEGAACRTFAQIKALRAEDRRHSDTGLSGNRTYRYLLIARTAAGDVSFEIAEVATPA